MPTLSITKKEPHIMEFVLVWIMFGVTAAVIATSKGRSFVGWLSLGLLFGLFALVAVCAMPRVSEESK